MARDRLMTPYGLRSLAKGYEYKGENYWTGCTICVCMCMCVLLLLLCSIAARAHVLAVDRCGSTLTTFFFDRFTRAWMAVGGTRRRALGCIVTFALRSSGIWPRCVVE